MSNQFYEKKKGTMGQYEQWWNYNPETGVVSHHWDDIRVRGGETRKGHKTYTVEEFLSGDHHRGAQDALRKRLEN